MNSTPHDTEPTTTLASCPPDILYAARACNTLAYIPASPPPSETEEDTTLGDDEDVEDDTSEYEPTSSICEHTCFLPLFVDPTEDQTPTSVPGFVHDPPQLLHCHWVQPSGQLCGTWFLPARTIKEHLAAHALAGFACGWSGCKVVPFKASNHLSRHVLENHGRMSRVRCVRCGQRFARIHARLAEHKCRPDQRRELKNRRPMIRDQTRSMGTADEPTASAYPAVMFM